MRRARYRKIGKQIHGVIFFSGILILLLISLLISQSTMFKTEKYFSKVVLKKGSGLESPNEGSLCIVNLHISQGDENILHEETKLQWLLGQDSGYVSEILNECLEEMHTGEICKITLHLCDELQDHLKSFNTSEQLPVDYALELVSFDKAKDSWESTFVDRCQCAQNHKEKGTRYYKAGLWLFSARHYSKALKSLILARYQLPSDSNGDDFSLLQVQCYNNLAACQLKLKRHQHVIDNCAKVVNMDSSNIKALYRRAQAYIAMKDLDQARTDLDKALQLDAKNKEVIKLKRRLEEKVK